MAGSLSCELAVISYALGEVPAAERESVLRKAWSATTALLVVVEPGTTRGFGVVNAARSWLIAKGAKLLAPCPHCNTCPMAAAGDWCHFAERVERTQLHRRLKGGELGYEDEKFSYVVASRAALPSADTIDVEPVHNFAFPAARARIVRHPQKRSGHVQLTLCTPQGLQADDQQVTEGGL